MCAGTRIEGFEEQSSKRRIRRVGFEEQGLKRRVHRVGFEGSFFHVGMRISREIRYMENTPVCILREILHMRVE